MPIRNIIDVIIGVLCIVLVVIFACRGEWLPTIALLIPTYKCWSDVLKYLNGDKVKQ